MTGHALSRNVDEKLIQAALKVSRAQLLLGGTVTTVPPALRRTAEDSLVLLDEAVEELRDLAARLRLTLLPGGADGAEPPPEVPENSGLLAALTAVSAATDGASSAAPMVIHEHYGVGASGELPDGHTRMPTAAFTYWVADDRWEWSEELYRLHGFEHGEVFPTTELVLAHKHPDDVASVAAVFGAAVIHGRPFVCRHRIIDAQRRQHTVVAFGEADRAPDGTIVAVRGVFADVSSQVERETRDACEAAIEGVTGTRSVIDQAKGSLMACYGLSDGEAFDVLRVVSNHTNRKIHDLAGRVVELLAARAEHHGDPERAVAELESGLRRVDTG